MVTPSPRLVIWKNDDAAVLLYLILVWMSKTVTKEWWMIPPLMTMLFLILDYIGHKNIRS